MPCRESMSVEFIWEEGVGRIREREGRYTKTDKRERKKGEEERPSAACFEGKTEGLGVGRACLLKGPLHLLAIS